MLDPRSVGILDKVQTGSKRLAMLIPEGYQELGSHRNLLKMPQKVSTNFLLLIGPEGGKKITAGNLEVRRFSVEPFRLSKRGISAGRIIANFRVAYRCPKKCIIPGEDPVRVVTNNFAASLRRRGDMLRCACGLELQSVGEEPIERSAITAELVDHMNSSAAFCGELHMPEVVGVFDTYRVSKAKGMSDVISDINAELYARRMAVRPFKQLDKAADVRELAIAIPTEKVGYVDTSRLTPLDRLDRGSLRDKGYKTEFLHKNSVL